MTRTVSAPATTRLEAARSLSRIAARKRSRGDPAKVVTTDAARAQPCSGIGLSDAGQRDLKGKGLTQLWSLQPAIIDGNEATC